MTPDIINHPQQRFNPRNPTFDAGKKELLGPNVSSIHHT